jgi:2'-5' RNA ligase
MTDMKRRIFIAINLPDDVKKRLAEYQEKIDRLFEPPSPVRWTRKDSLHITLEFLGYLTDDEIMKACQETEDFAKKHKTFSITLNKIIYGPPQKPPRMIWAVGERIKELNLVPHITLGRIRMMSFRQIEPDERPQIEEEINLSFEVSSVEVMESHLKHIGPDYTILESCPLKI